MGFPDCTVVKNLPTNAGDARDTDSIPGSGRSSGGGNGSPLLYSCLDNSIEKNKPGVLQSMSSQRVQHDWVTEHAYTIIKDTCYNSGLINWVNSSDSYWHGKD